MLAGLLLGAACLLAQLPGDGLEKGFKTPPDSAKPRVFAHRIADRYGLYLYATDDVMAEHSRRSRPEDCPLLHEFIAMDMDDRWVHRSPATMLETFHWFRGEAFNMIIDDLLGIPTDVRVVAEGFRLLPHLVKTTIERRGGRTSGFLAKTSNFERARQNLLERDRMSTDRLKRDVEKLGLCAIEVDSAISESDSANLVAKIFGL